MWSYVWSSVKEYCFASIYMSVCHRFHHTFLQGIFKQVKMPRILYLVQKSCQALQCPIKLVAFNCSSLMGYSQTLEVVEDMRRNCLIIYFWWKTRTVSVNFGWKRTYMPTHCTVNLINCGLYTCCLTILWNWTAGCIPVQSHFMYCVMKLQVVHMLTTYINP